MNTTHTYKIILAGSVVAADSSYLTAVSIAKDKGAEVWDSKPDGTPNMRRWHPMPAKAPKRRIRHVLVNADGTKTEFGSIRGVHS